MKTPEEIIKNLAFQKYPQLHFLCLSDKWEYFVNFLNEYAQQPSQKNECEAGCRHLSGGDIKHHKDCQFYPESLSELIDKQPAQGEGYTLNLNKTEALYSIRGLMHKGLMSTKPDLQPMERAEIIDGLINDFDIANPPKIFTGKYRVGRKLGRVVLDENGLEVVKFKEGFENHAIDYCHWLNAGASTTPSAAEGEREKTYQDTDQDWTNDLGV